METQELESRENWDCYIRKLMPISQFHPGPPVVNILKTCDACEDFAEDFNLASENSDCLEGTRRFLCSYSAVSGKEL